MQKSKITEGIVTFLKGIVMGSANVIPGVSGGTFAIILGILERLVDAVKSFNRHALHLVFKKRFKDLSDHIDLVFLLELFAGVACAVFSLAKVLSFLFDNYPVFVWSFFFGLIVGSIYYVGRRVKKWSPIACIGFVVGTAIAVGISYLPPATENESIPYVGLCGVLASAAMILPGISGSFVLILMGNYELIVIDGIGNLRFEILIPFAASCGLGLLALSHLLSYVLKKFRNVTISTLTGFILGSLLLIWPWKTPVYKLDKLGEQLIKDGEPVIFKYERFIPDDLNPEVIGAIIFALLGVALMLLAEHDAHKGGKEDLTT